MHKYLVNFKVTLKIVTRLNYCFLSAHCQTIPQIIFNVIRAGESFFNLSKAVVV